QRSREHEAIRDDLVRVFRAGSGISVRTTDAGSYIFPKLPKMVVSGGDFVRLLRLQADVIVTPGTEFSPHAGDCIRLNFSQDHVAAVAAGERIVALAARYRAGAAIRRKRSRCRRGSMPLRRGTAASSSPPA